MPSIAENCPTEIIIELGTGGASEKRNRGWRKATQPFLFFCDDDVVLRDGTLELLLDALVANEQAGWAYGHFMVRHAGGECRVPDRDVSYAEPFSVKLLRSRNIMSTMSLVRDSAFPGWDENLKSYIDWDGWLTMAGAGWLAERVDEILFDTYYLDRGISAQPELGPISLKYIREKHGL